MQRHWTQNGMTKEMVETLADEDISRALLDRLVARIARRHGRPRRRMPARQPLGEITRPVFPEAA